MRRRWILLLFFAIGCATSLPATAPDAGDRRSLAVMTFNLRFADDAPPNRWADRRPVVRELLELSAPDIVGTQEGLYRQLTDIATDLPAYAWIGQGREGGSHGEFMAIFYRRERFVLREYDHFWLSDTPDRVGSRTWGNRFSRMVTWARLRDRRTGRQLYVVNTHFDHEVAEARERSAALLLERVRELDPALPILLLGDFNAAAGASTVYDRLTGDGAFVDTWRAAGRTEPPFGTFHDFGGEDAAAGEPRIDWILTHGAVTTRSTEIITFARHGQYPSDHFPVFARVELGGCGRVGESRRRLSQMP